MVEVFLSMLIPVDAEEQNVEFLKFLHKDLHTVKAQCVGQ
jgi:hypothetical protein